MVLKKKQVNSESLSKIIVDGMLEKKATDVLVMDLRGIKGAFADFFILCNGNSDTQVDAISDSIEWYGEKQPPGIYEKGTNPCLRQSGSLPNAGSAKRSGRGASILRHGALWP